MPVSEIRNPRLSPADDVVLIGRRCPLNPSQLLCVSMNSNMKSWPLLLILLLKLTLFGLYINYLKISVVETMPPGTQLVFLPHPPSPPPASFIELLPPPLLP